MTHPLLEGTKSLVRRFRMERRTNASLTAEEYLQAHAADFGSPAEDQRAQWIELLDVARSAPEDELDPLISEWLEGQASAATRGPALTLPLAQDPDATLPGPTPPPVEDAKFIDRRYRIARVLGEGAFGKVFLVKDKLQNDQELALKLIKREHTQTSEALMRFKNEILLLRVLNHPGIPQIFNDGISEDGEFYYTMAYVAGRTLDDVIRKEAPLDPTRIVRITKQVLDVLDYAHSRGAIHRDLKPGNIFLLHAGTAKEQVRVLDFGIAKVLSREGVLEHAQTMNTEMPLGTPHYMSPEQVRGTEVDGRTDLYALGVIIYQMCSGRFPFSGKTLMEILAARLEKPPNPLEDATTPAWLREIVMKLLEREREQRPDTTAIRVMLDHLQDSHRALNKRLTWIGVAVVVIAGLVAWSVFGGGKKNDAETAQLESTHEQSPDPAGSDASKPNSPPASGENGKSDQHAPSAAPDAPKDDAEKAPANSEKPTSDPKPDVKPTPPEQPAKSPAPPAFTVLKLEPAQSPLPRVPPEQKLLRISGQASRPLSSVKVAGVALTLDPSDPTHFEAEVTLPQAPMNGRDEDRALSIELVDKLEFKTVVQTLGYRRVAARLPKECSAAVDASVDDRGRVTSIVHDATKIPLALVELGGAAPFYLGVHEVTRDEWGRGPKRLATLKTIPPAPEGDQSGEHPVTGVSFDAAQEFCEQFGLRLPLASEWESAAASSGGNDFPWGAAPDDKACNSSSKEDGFAGTAPVASFPKDRCGPFFDMAGNVQEFCVDSEAAAALRGGGWRLPPTGCKITSAGTAPPLGSVSIGFRVAISCER